MNVTFFDRGYGSTRPHPRDGETAAVLAADPDARGLVVKFEDGTITWIHESETVE